MLSQMALEDIDQLKVEGIEPTPQEIVRLNAFGLKVERGTDSCEFSVMPRVAILGDAVIHEPTIGSETWLADASRHYDLDDPDTYIQMRAYSLWRTGERVDPGDAEGLKADIGKMLATLSGYTLGQLTNALSYAIHGNDPSDGERPPRTKKDDGDSKEPDDDDVCYEIGLMRNGVLFGLGSKEELDGMTTSSLELLVTYRMQLEHGPNARKNDHTRRLVDYYAVLDEIRKAHGQ